MLVHDRGVDFCVCGARQREHIIPWLSAVFPSADGRNENRRQLVAMTNSVIICV